MIINRINKRCPKILGQEIFMIFLEVLDAFFGGFGPGHGFVHQIIRLIVMPHGYGWVSRSGGIEKPFQDIGIIPAIGSNHQIMVPFFVFRLD